MLTANPRTSSGALFAAWSSAPIRPFELRWFKNSKTTCARFTTQEENHADTLTKPIDFTRLQEYCGSHSLPHRWARCQRKPLVPNRGAFVLFDEKSSNCIPAPSSLVNTVTNRCP